jgi:hypothetical protein
VPDHRAGPLESPAARKKSPAVDFFGVAQSPKSPYSGTSEILHLPLPLAIGFGEKSFNFFQNASHLTFFLSGKKLASNARGPPGGLPPLNRPESRTRPARDPGETALLFTICDPALSGIFHRTHTKTTSGPVTLKPVIALSKGTSCPHCSRWKRPPRRSPPLPTPFLGRPGAWSAHPSLPTAAVLQLTACLLPRLRG